MVAGKNDDSNRRHCRINIKIFTNIILLTECHHKLNSKTLSLRWINDWKSWTMDWFFPKCFSEVVFKLPNKNFIHKLYQWSIWSNWRARGRQVCSPTRILLLRGEFHSYLAMDHFLSLAMAIVLKCSFIKNKPLSQTKAT